MDIVEDITKQASAAGNAAPRTCVQPGGYFLELSFDWIVLRASENIHHLLDKSHVTVIDEPLGNFVKAQALHDLRNLFSRLSGTMGIARAYRIRLTDEPDLFDVSFQVSEGRVLLEAVPSSQDGFGEAFGTVGGLINGLGESEGQALLEGGARRMRALTGFDRITLIVGGKRVESSRGAFSAGAHETPDLPFIIHDAEASPVEIFPREGETSAKAALLRAPTADQANQLREAGICSVLRVPIMSEGVQLGEFLCENKRQRAASFELHAAAELFAQLFALRLEIDRLKNG